MGKEKLTTSPNDYQNSPPPASGPDQPQDKKPFYKKKWFVILAALMLLVLIFPMSNPNEAPNRSLPPESSSVGSLSESLAASSQPESESSQTEDEGPKKSGTYTLPCGMKINFSDSVRNDVTGKWRISSTSDSLVPADHAIEYYEMMFSSDDEIHAIWNATLNTTTRISVLGNLLLVDTMEHVDKEENDANLLFSGMLLDIRIVNRETGEITKAIGADVEPPEESSSQEAVSDVASESEAVIPIPVGPDPTEPTAKPEPNPEPEQNPVSSPKSNGGAGNPNNFDTYDNKEQQNTSANYVLNTNTMKFHVPGCKSVKKIAPQNYEEFYGTRDEAIAMGYKACGICHP